MVILSGGEPLLSQSTDNVVSWARNRDIASILTTNGALLTQAKAKSLHELGLSGVQVSLMSLSPEVHDELSGRRSWRQAVAGICQSVKADIPTAIVVTATQQNLQGLPKMVQFAGQIGVRRVIVNELREAGMAAVNRVAAPSDGFFKEQCAAARLTASRFGVEVVEVSPSRSPLNESWHRIVIGADGHIRLCNVSPTSYGKITSMSDSTLSKLISTLSNLDVQSAANDNPDCACLAYRRVPKQA